MQYRQLPPAGTLDDVEAVYRAVPRDPTETDDCCARLCDRTSVERREHASEWLVFLTALDCVTDDGEGYYRTEETFEGEQLADRFVSRVFGVQATLELLESADEPLTNEEIADCLADQTRRRLERIGSAYLDRLLAWATAFELVAQTDDGYVRRST